ncbi:MAG: hypothetical protein LBU06_12340 [Desulfovibrio sp.]|jgi:hypothetical protein|nr:hypothetical protein [Desulfovibrio sp.]
MHVYGSAIPAVLAYIAFIHVLVSLLARPVGRKDPKNPPVCRRNAETDLFRSSDLTRPDAEPKKTASDALRTAQAALSGLPLTALPSLAVFPLLPVGSLPPLVPADFGLLLALGLLGAAFITQRKRRAALGGLASLGLAAGTAAFVAWRRGLPGATCDPGVFMAVPLWSVLDGVGRIGLLCLTAGLLILTGRAFSPEDPEDRKESEKPEGHGSKKSFARYALCLASGQFTLALLQPLTFTLLLPFAPPALTLCLDFLLNWLLLLFLVFRLRPFAASCVKAAFIPPLLLAAGASLCLIDAVS